jgi:hypothetical protein
MRRAERFRGARRARRRRHQRDARERIRADRIVARDGRERAEERRLRPLPHARLLVLVVPIIRRCRGQVGPRALPRFAGLWTRDRLLGLRRRGFLRGSVALIGGRDALRDLGVGCGALRVARARLVEVVDGVRHGFRRYRGRGVEPRAIPVGVRVGLGPRGRVDVRCRALRLRSGERSRERSVIRARQGGRQLDGARITSRDGGDRARHRRHVARLSVDSLGQPLDPFLRSP